jgi:beta-xylosidase
MHGPEAIRLVLAGLLVSLALAPSAVAGEPNRLYRNPLLEGNLADPTVLRHEGAYYLYATGEVDGDNGYRAYASSNLVDWVSGPVVFRPGLRHIWAPDLWRDPASGTFYLYYTAAQNIGVARASSPLGPFTLVGQLVESAIDAHLFRDEDGRLFLYYVRLPGFRITVRELASPSEFKGEERLVLQPESDWEKKSGHVTEGPWVIKHAGTYYLIYSGSGADTPNYAVGYATASHPMGPFTRAAHNPIIQRTETVFGPGHGCVLQDEAGHWWHIYHQKTSAKVEWSRFIALDPIWFDREGRLHSRATRATDHPAPIVRHGGAAD